MRRLYLATKSGNGGPRILLAGRSGGGEGRANTEPNGLEALIRRKSEPSILAHIAKGVARLQHTGNYRGQPRAAGVKWRDEYVVVCRVSLQRPPVGRLRRRCRHALRESVVEEQWRVDVGGSHAGKRHPAEASVQAVMS